MTWTIQFNKVSNSNIFLEKRQIYNSRLKYKVDWIYAQRCIVGNCVSIDFLSFLLLVYLTRKFFLNSQENYFCPNIAYYSWASALLFIYLFIGK